jgi:hypothetical protein
MNILIRKLIVCFLLIPLHAGAQEYLLIQPSPQIAGYGGAGTSLPTDDPYGFHYNPAQLGYLGQTENLAFHNTNMDFVFEYIPHTYSYSAAAIAAGYNFMSKYQIPLSIGAGFMKGTFSLGEHILTDEQGNELGRFESKEWFNAFSIGMLYKYYINFGFGLTYKSITSDLGPLVSVDNFLSGSLKGGAVDFGLLLSAPIFDFLGSPSIIQFDNGTYLQPKADLSIGYAQVNIGDELKNSDNTQFSPLPREARLGIGFSLGLNYNSKDFKWKLFSIQAASEANDILRKWHPEAGRVHDSFTGDISLLDHVFGMTADEEVTNRLGMKLNFGEMFQYSIGRIHQSGSQIKFETQGYVFSLRGIIKCLMVFSPDLSTKLYLNHIDISYSSSTQKYKNRTWPVASEYTGFSISIYDF